MVLRKRESRSSPPSRSRVERPGSFLSCEGTSGVTAEKLIATFGRHIRPPDVRGAADDIIFIGAGFIGAGFIGAGEIFALLAAKDYRRYSPDSNLR